MDVKKPRLHVEARGLKIEITFRGIRLSNF